MEEGICTAGGELCNLLCVIAELSCLRGYSVTIVKHGDSYTGTLRWDAETFYVPSLDSVSDSFDSNYVSISVGMSLHDYSSDEAFLEWRHWTREQVVGDLQSIKERYGSYQ